MVEKVPNPLIQETYNSLQQRLMNAATVPDSPYARRIDDSSFWPARSMKIADVPPMETFVRLVEAMNRHLSAQTPTKAKNTLAYSVQLARKLKNQLPGNDEAVKFSIMGVRLVEMVNPELGEDVARVIAKVYDEEKFE